MKGEALGADVGDLLFCGDADRCSTQGLWPDSAGEEFPERSLPSRRLKLAFRGGNWEDEGVGCWAFGEVGDVCAGGEATGPTLYTGLDVVGGGLRCSDTAGGFGGELGMSSPQPSPS